MIAADGSLETRPAVGSSASQLPLISIIIPTYNEAEDIRRTLEAIVRLAYPRKEVIVVDNSRDGTSAIVQEFAAQGVLLLRQQQQDGRSGARNQGILQAVGDVVVILNADVLLPPDFLSRIAQHYMQGADYVLVESRVENLRVCSRATPMQKGDLHTARRIRSSGRKVSHAGVLRCWQLACFQRASP